MDGNFKTVYPEKKKKWPNEQQQKNAEDFEKGYKERAKAPFSDLLKKLFGEKKKEQK
jgi:hypothetical protein